MAGVLAGVLLRVRPRWVNRGASSGRGVRCLTGICEGRRTEKKLRGILCRCGGMTYVEVEFWGQGLEVG